MDRMKLFLTYFLCLVGFIFLSHVLEDGLMANMYVRLKGTVESPSYGVEISDVEGKASNVSGNMSFKITDKSQDEKEKYVKIDLYNKSGRHVSTKYIPIEDLDKNNQKEIKIKLKGQQIRGYDISVIDNLPDKTNIINVFGWEFDASNFLGMDLTDSTIFGRKVTDVFEANDVFDKDEIKGGLSGIWAWIVSFTSSVPWWGYAVGAGIILWYMPAKFLFGIFPF